MSEEFDNEWSDEYFDEESEFLEEFEFEEDETFTKCNACFGYGMDRNVDADCLVCYGEGYV